ncbi:MAG: hypothetical protein ABI472_07795 [Ginsengibacter sp.]
MGVRMERKKQQKLFIIHFQPLELFPPAMNMIDYLSRISEQKIIVITNKNSNLDLLSKYEPVNVKIYRPAKLSGPSMYRYLNYFFFYLSAFFLLLRHHPKLVLYFETLSSWPALMYKKIKKRTSLMVHYHEYTEPKLYGEGMFLVRWMHEIETKMYGKFSWISHTNPVRLQIFKNDEKLESMSASIFHVLPNYPPKSWLTIKKNDSLKNKKKRLVFVGSLGYKNMYLQEVIDWLDIHPEELSLDIYAYKIDEKAKQVLAKANNKNIRYCGGCDYFSLPEILINYDIGLVIYKPFSQNTIHAVSNKVFEYLACGLDVWFSVDMTYTFEYARQSVYPKVIPVNFKELNSFDFALAISKENLQYEASPFFYENVYPEVLNHINVENDLCE